MNMLTGGSLPVAKAAPVLRKRRATVAQDGCWRDATLVRRRGDTIAGIVRARCRRGAELKAPTQLTSPTRWSGVFVPVVVVIALVTFGLTWWFAGDPTGALLRAVAVLVIACPCCSTVLAVAHRHRRRP